MNNLNNNENLIRLFNNLFKSDKSIPSNLINIISYQIKKTELEHHKTI